MEDKDILTTLAVFRALQLHGWSEKLQRRISLVANFEVDLQDLEDDVNTNSREQRDLMIDGLDRLKEIIDGKKEQLLSRGKMEMQQKLTLIEAQRAQLEPEVVKTRQLRERIAKIQNLGSRETFMGVCGRTTNDIRGFLSDTKPLYLSTDANFRPFKVDAAQRALGNVDLVSKPVVKPEKPLAKSPASATPPSRAHGTVPSYFHADPASMATEPSNIPVAARNGNHGQGCEGVFRNVQPSSSFTPRVVQQSQPSPNPQLFPQNTAIVRNPQQNPQFIVRPS